MKNELETFETFVSNKQTQKAEHSQGRRNAANESKKRYKTRECASLQVFLQEDLVNEFKTLVRKNGHTQAGVIRGLVRSYLSTADTNTRTQPSGG